MTRKARVLWVLVVSELVMIGVLSIAWYVDRQAKYARLNRMQADLERLEGVIKDARLSRMQAEGQVKEVRDRPGQRAEGQQP